MNHISLENYLILTVENGQIEVLYDAQATDLYLYKAENYYLTRNKSHIISACLSENILLIKSGRKTDIVNTPFLKIYIWTATLYLSKWIQNYMNYAAINTNVILRECY